MTGQVYSGLICTRTGIEYLTAMQPFPNQTDEVKDACMFQTWGKKPCAFRDCQLLVLSDLCIAIQKLNLKCTKKGFWGFIYFYISMAISIQKTIQ